MWTDRDLFGQEATKPVVVVRKRDGVPKGYAAMPGTGPQGETCKTCAHYTKTWRNKYRKCALMQRLWTKGPGTDIKAGSPACRNWEKPL